MCDSCEVLNINSMNCHETGCPDAWRDHARECAWCSSEFVPDESGQDCCDNDCAASYHGWDNDGWNDDEWSDDCDDDCNMED